MKSRDELQIICFRCKRVPSQIDEYVHNPEDDPDPVRFVMEEEGTYNPENGHFCCTECYIKIGMPTGGEFGRWIAP